MNEIIIDLEATCCDDGSIPDSERETIEIGAVAIEPSGIAGEFNAFVRPIRHPILTDFCVKLTRIGRLEIDEARTFPAVFSSFLDWMKQYGSPDYFWSWGWFDKVQLQRDCEYHQFDYPFKDHKDLSRFFKKKTGHRLGASKAMKFLGLEEVGLPHRGIVDARNRAKILIALKERS